LPPFWKTGWFITIFIFSVLGVAFFVGYQYIKRLKMREQNIIMEHRLLASQMNPHFISNTLTAIQYFVYNNESQKAGNYLSNFSRLIRLILDSSREEYVSIEKELQTVKHYLNLQQLRFVGKFDYDIEVDPDINEKLIYIAPMLSQPFIENSIEHGIMHLKNKGKIDVRYHLIEDNMLEICIKDNGIGIRQSQELNSRRETHHSHATAITRERLVTMGKGKKVKPTIEITDLSDNQGNSGTRVVIRCPYVYHRKLKKLNILP
jgi:LytS/YehU family sensor histidine kinase